MSVKGRAVRISRLEKKRIFLSLCENPPFIQSVVGEFGKGAAKTPAREARAENGGKGKGAISSFPTKGLPDSLRGVPLLFGGIFSGLY